MGQSTSKNSSETATTAKTKTIDASVVAGFIRPVAPAIIFKEDPKKPEKERTERAEKAEKAEKTEQAKRIEELKEMM
jgi:hypothetical protein